MDQSTRLFEVLESAGVLEYIADHQQYRESTVEPLFKKLRPFFVDGLACQYCLSDTSEGTALTVLFTGAEDDLQFAFFHAPRVAAPFFIFPGEGLFSPGGIIQPKAVSSSLIGCSINLSLPTVPSGIQLSSCSPFLGRVLVLLGSFEAFTEEQVQDETASFLSAAMAESGRVFFQLEAGVALYGTAKACSHLHSSAQ